MIMSAEAWGLFLFACFMLYIAPGPDLIFVLSRAIAHGRKVGFAAILGVSCGAMVHVMAAALGVSAILATSATAFMVVKYIGASYLVWLGIKSLLSRQAALLNDADKGKRITPWVAFRQGILIDVLNPKVALFFMAFIPQFISHEAGRASSQIFIETVILGAIVVLIGILVEMVFVYAAAPLGRYLRSNQAFALWLERSFGALLVGLGARLAASD